jgi:hypothetical protein
MLGRVDGALVVVRERVVQTQDRVKAARITTDDIEKALKGWAKREAGERLLVLGSGS